jgi:hypothetical protein
MVQTLEQKKASYLRNREKILSKRKEKRKNPEYVEKQKLLQKKYYEENKEKVKAKQRERNKKVRLDVLEHYGGKCECCGESRYEFLSIDHINNDGKKDREIAGVGTSFYYWVIKEKYPGNLRILCHNCNMAYYIYGTCPHKNKREKNVW